MISIKIFLREACPKCPAMKEMAKRLKEQGMRVSQYDTDTAGGLAEASFYSVSSTPSLILEDEEAGEVKGWRGSVPTLEEVKPFLPGPVS